MSEFQNRTPRWGKTALGGMFSGLRFRLVILVVLASTPPVALTLRSALQDRKREVADLRQRAMDLIQSATREEDEMIGGTRQLLRAIAESAQIKSGQWKSSEQLLSTLLADNPRYANLGVIKTNGELAASALPSSGVLNLADRHYFQRALNTGAFSIGDYQVGRISGKPSVNFGYPVMDSSNRVHAIVYAALDLEWLNRTQFALQVRLPEGAQWIKIDLNGTVLVRHPAPEKWIGQPLQEKALLETFLSRKNGVLDVIDDRKVSVVYTFASTRSSLVAGDVITILSIPRDILFAAANRTVARNLGLVGLTAGLIMLIGWFGSYALVLRPIRDLLQITSRLGSGDRGARIALPNRRDEVGELTRAFDKMAQGLEDRERESERARQQLRQSEERFRALVQNSSDLIGIIDAEGNILYRSPNFPPALGYEPAEVLGTNLLEYFWPDDLDRAQKRLSALRESSGATHWDEFRLRCKDGTCRFVEATSSNYLADPAIQGIVFNFRDITKRKQAEAALREYSQRLQILSHRLVEVQETERRHLARELHDEVGQSLTAVEMSLQTALRTSTDGPLKCKLGETLHVVERVLTQVRDLSLNLRPSMLDDLGLEPALRWYTNQQSRLTGLKVYVETDPLEHRLDPRIETECFRITQEAINNVVKHAKAESVTVELRRSNGTLHLKIRDNGVGFDVLAVREQAVRGSSLGLLSMEERAVLAGGGLEYNTAPGKGSEVHAWFPLKWQSEKA